MTDHAHALLQDALALPVDERAELVRDLLASLESGPADDPGEVAAAWRHELDRRGSAALSGTTPGADWPTVRDALRDELGGT